MTAFIDARTLPTGTVLKPDIAIIGGGPAGISLALALADTGAQIALLESGGFTFDPKIQNMYEGAQSGVPYLALGASRLRFLGGSTNHWGGWCRPLDDSDFEARPWVPHSGWPISKKDLAPYYPRAQQLVESGPWVYDAAGGWTGNAGPMLGIGPGGVYTSWFQFSKTRDSDLPTYFGTRYGDDLKRAARVTPYLHASVLGLRLTHNAAQIDHLDAGTLGGNRFTVRPRLTVLATGGMENARLLLASNDVAAAGVGNGHDLVGRFFADNPTPRNVATLVVFAGSLSPYYLNPFTTERGVILQAIFAPGEAFKRARGVMGSLTTVDGGVKLDELGQAAVIVTSAALGVDGSNAKAFSLGCGLELMPDPERRLTLTSDRDALGMPRLKLAMTISDDIFAQYNETMSELGRQLLAARTGMVRLNLKSRADWLGQMEWGNHHSGTTRMSAYPKTGVVDADSKVHGIGNLYIAGSSVFPVSGASNPTMNLLALTLRLADHLRNMLR